MTSTPTISISGTSISNEVMSLITAASSTGSFTQLGGDIDGPTFSSKEGNSGWSVSMSSDGTRVAIGAPFHHKGGSNGDDGLVRIYELQSDNSWSQLGADIVGVEYNDYNGYSVSLSADGTRVAVGAYGHNKNGATDAGHVRIYQYTPSGTSSWTLYGDIDGEGAGDASGFSVSISSDGKRVAIGAVYNDGNGSNSGHVRIYENTSGSMWTKLGSDIDGEAAGDYSGRGVSLSSDGSRVAIGAINNDGNGSNSGHVRVFEYQVISGTATWTQLGQDIDGEAESDESGSSISLSSDGSRVAIGAMVNGHVRIYDYNGSAWVQVGADINGDAAQDNSGH